MCNEVVISRFYPLPHEIKGTQGKHQLSYTIFRPKFEFEELPIAIFLKCLINMEQVKEGKVVPVLN
jgi:hypothetical protein